MAREIGTPLIQIEFIDGLMQLCMNRMGIKDYEMAVNWLAKLIEWMPGALIDNPGRRAVVLTMLAECKLAINQVSDCLHLVNESLAINYTVASFFIKIKAMLALSLDDTELITTFKSFKLTEERDAIFELFRMIADARSAELAFACLGVALPHPNILDDSVKQDLAIVKLAIAMNDKHLSEQEKIQYTQSMLEREELSKWSSPNHKALHHFIQLQSDRCIKQRFFGIALKWLEMGGVIFAEDEGIVQEMRHRLVQCHLEMGRLEEAEGMILSTPNDLQGCILRIQLSIKQERLSDAIALINRMTALDGIKASHFISLLDRTESELVKVHVLKAALVIEPDNSSIIKALLSLTAVTDELEAGSRIDIVLNYVQHCNDMELVKKVTWNIGQLAIQGGRHSEAVKLFQACMEAIPGEDGEECLLAHFFKCQSIYHDSKHVYTEGDLNDLKRARQLSDKEFPKCRHKRSTPRIQDKQRLQQLLCLFMVKALIHLSRWNDLRQAIEMSFSEEIVPLVLNSTANIPMDIHHQCLRKLLESLTSIDIDHFATLFRGMAMTALLMETNSAIGYFRQVHPIASMNDYPREEVLWLCVTCFNTAMLMQSWKDRGRAQEWCELAISFCHCLHAEDKGVYESRIRHGYSAILQGEK